MAIHSSRTQTGMSWVKESIALFKLAPNKWITLAIVYITLFMMLPSVPGLQFLAFLSVLVWPIFMAIAVGLYRNADIKKQESIGALFQHIQPKMTMLIALGASCLLYALLVSFLLNSDIENLAKIAQNKDKMSESQVIQLMQQMLPFLLKLSLLLIPLMMATWFSPMLIAFNNYPLVKAIKSSIAGSLQYMVALAVAWLVLSVGLVGLMLLVAIVMGIIASLLPNLAQVLMTFAVFGCLLLATALMFAFQYVSYRDVFRAA